MKRPIHFLGPTIGVLLYGLFEGLYRLLTAYLPSGTAWPIRSIIKLLVLHLWIGLAVSLLILVLQLLRPGKLADRPRSSGHPLLGLWVATWWVGLVAARQRWGLGAGFFEPATILLLAAAPLVLYLGIRLVRPVAVRSPARHWVGTAAVATLCLFALVGIRARTVVETTVASDRPSLLLVTLDTTRQDALAVYGGPAEGLEEFADTGLLFEEAYATAPVTLPSHASILTGLYPRRHGSRENGLRLREDVPTLAEDLLESGWSTAAFLSAPVLSEELAGLSRGFRHWDEQFGPWAPISRFSQFRAAAWLLKEHTPFGSGFMRFYTDAIVRDAATTVDQAVAWLAEQSGPSFAWVHLFDAHFPYEPPGCLLPPDYRPGKLLHRNVELFTNQVGLRADEVELARKLYHEEVGTVLRETSRLIQAAQTQFGRERLVVAVVADHGEEFGEHHRWFAHDDIYEPVLRIPLLLAGPGIPVAQRCATPVSQVDLRPTLLALLGLPVPGDLDGVDLRPIWEGSSDRPPLFFDAAAVTIPEPPFDEVVGIRLGRTKLRFATPRAEDAHSESKWFAVGGGLERADGAERFAENLREKMTGQLADWLIATRETAALRAVDPSARSALDALGYVEGGN